MAQILKQAIGCGGAHPTTPIVGSCFPLGPAPFDYPLFVFVKQCDVLRYPVSVSSVISVPSRLLRIGRG